MISTREERQAPQTGGALAANAERSGPGNVQLKQQLRGLDYASGAAVLAVQRQEDATAPVTEPAPAETPAADPSAAPAEEHAAEAAAVLDGQMIVSNNPEEIYRAGIILQKMRLSPGTAGLFIHHFNRQGRDGARPGLEFHAIVRPVDASGSTQVGWGTSATGGKYTGKETYRGGNSATEDVNGRNAKKALHAQLPKAGQALKGPARFPIGSLPPSAGPLLLNARSNLTIAGGDVEVDIVCCAPGDDALRVTDMALGSTKLYLEGTHGRPAGVYEGAMLTDTRSVDVSALDKPFMYPLTAGKKMPAPTPEATQQKTANIDPKRVTGILDQARKSGSDEATQTRALVQLLEVVYQISETWLAEAKIVVGGKLADPESWAKHVRPKTDPSFARMIKGLFVAIQGSWDAHDQWKGVLGHLQENGVIGAKADGANYGTMYDLDFALDNSAGTAGAEVRLQLYNEAATPWRGVIAVNGQDVVVSKEKKGDPGKETAQGVYPLGAQQVEAGKQRNVNVRFMSPGQIATGQQLKLERTGAAPPKKAGPAQ